MLLKRPGLSAAALLSLALGIGANATVFTWVKGILLRPMPGVQAQEDIVVFENRNRAGTAISASYPDFVDYRAGARTIALVGQDDVAVSLTTNDRPERVYGSLVTGNYFDVLGVKLALGRGFLADEDRVPNLRPVVVLGHGLWERRLNADPAIVGREITLNGHAFTVVGVAPPEFIGTYGGLLTELWVPMMMQPLLAGDRLNERGNHWMTALGRLNPGVSRNQAQAELNLLAKQLAAAHPNTNAGTSILLYPLWRAPGGAAKAMGPVLLVLGVVVSLVLLIACANVANLLLGRALDRRREIAIRLAMGASRGRLARQLLTEGLLLSVAGGLAGVLVARWSANLLMAFLPPVDMPLRLALDVDWRVLAFTMTIALASGVLFGLAPAFQGTRSDVVTALKEELGTSTGGQRKARLRNALVAAQVALSVILLVGAALFLQSMRNAQRLDPGFETRRVLLASMDLFAHGYTEETGRQFQQQLIARVGELPGVTSAAIARRVPINLGGRSSSGIRVDGYQPAPDEEMSITFNNVSPDYFRTMGIPVLRGREFSERDSGGTPNAVIVNQTMAARFWKGQDPTGRQIHLGPDTLTVVGVVKDITYQELGERPMSFMYLPLYQYYRADVILHVRTAGDPAALAGAVRAEAAALDARLPLFDVKPMAVHLRVGVFIQRMAGMLLGLFALLALVLATVGLFGVLNYLVGQRSREIGLRLALGATRRDVLGMIVRHGLTITAVGLVAGIVLAAGLMRLASRLLHEVSAADPATFAGVSAMMLLVAAVASWAPARRAARLDPVQTLRRE